MYGQLVACGSAARLLSHEYLLKAWPIKSHTEIIAPHPEIVLARFTPPQTEHETSFLWSDDKAVLVSVDGFLLTDRIRLSAPHSQHAISFANLCSGEGYEAAWRSIVAGSFNLVVVDLSRHELHVTKDHIGTFSLYHSPVDGGWLLSSNPVALALTGLVNTEIDLTACAEWAFIGYTIGDRYMTKGIRNVRPDTAFRWDLIGAKGGFDANPDSPWNILPDRKSPPVDDAIDSLVEACRRVSLVDPAPANFQSAGWDSRAILAAWPDSYNPTCYTYGDPDSHEVHIAHTVADTRASRWVHVWPGGDEAAHHLETLFDMTGHIVFPDRYFTARQMRQDSHTGALDGFIGGVLVGHGYYTCDRHFSPVVRVVRLAGLYRDQSVSAVGFDRVAEALLDDIQEISDPAELCRYVTYDVSGALNREKPGILQDIRDELTRLKQSSDSLSVLWRNFFMANRSAHAIVQQAVLSRAFVHIYCPFSGDLDFLRLQMRIRPADAAHHRYYREIYRRKFPKFGKILYGDSLMPLHVAPLRHRISRMIIEEGYTIPGLTANANGRERDANSWGRWLRQSERLRLTTLQLLRDGGMIDEQRAATTLHEVCNGSRRWFGKLFHLASIARWMSLSGNNSGY
ncbi:MAG: hypothetical protein AB1644_04275 [Candidatus Zixiibacteriota bacterium]